MLGTLMITPRFTAWDDAGNPLPGALLHTYVAGTPSTNTPTYFDEDLATIHANANPVVCDAAGRCIVFLVPGTAYKFRLETALGVLVWEQDHVTAGPYFNGTDLAGTAGELLPAGSVVYLSDGSGARTAGRWYLASAAFAYSSSLPTIGMVQSAIANGTVGVVRLAGTVTGLAGLTAGVTYYVSPTVAGALTATQPASNVARVVGVADTTTSIVLSANPANLAANAGVVQTTALAGPQDDLVLTADVRVLRCTNASLLTLSSMAAGYSGQRVTILSLGAGDVQLANNTGGPTPANRFLNFLSSVVNPTYLAAGTGSADVVYDTATARWRMVAHAQGAPLAWVPADGSGGAPGVTVVTASFTVVGRWVTFETQIVYPATGSGANAKLTGLPYTPIGRCVVGVANCPVDIRASITAANFIDLVSPVAVPKTNLQMTLAGMYLSGTYLAG